MSTQSYTYLNPIIQRVLKCAFDIHSALGPGLLESTYKECLFYKLSKEGLLVEKEKPIPLIFEEVKLECGYRLDLLVERKIVIELKSVEQLTDVHTAQVLTCLKLGKFPIGYLMNFNVAGLKLGIRRFVN
ncbi:MAG: GxxExxY protein [Spirosomataceae bacterium]|jgi:GxxExxY protein